MKKIKFYFIFIIMSFMMLQLSQAQMLGKWVIPTELVANGNVTYVFELTFNENNITYELLPLPFPTAQLPPLAISSGGYNSNYETKFYVAGNNLVYGSSYSTWEGQPDLIYPEYQIIRKPGSLNEYYTFYSNFVHHERDDFSCNKITYNETSGVATISDVIDLRESDDGYPGFAISKIQDNERFLYASMTEQDGQPSYDAGLYRWIIGANGIVYDDVILDENDLSATNFSAYNMEMKTNINEEIVFAWINGINQQGSQNLIVVIDGDPEVYNLNQGAISGIEFSSLQDDMLYVSCTGTGILKVNYTTGNVVSTVVSNDFEQTFLQTAPDGHIYGVSNDGRHLGKINMQNGSFTSSAFTFNCDDPPYYNIENTVGTYREFSPNDPYYTLPENEHVQTDMTVSVETENASCPGYSDGSAIICVTGGVPGEDPEYYILCFDPQGEVIDDYYYDVDDNCFELTDLYAGTYIFEIMDDIGGTIRSEFIINDGYDFEDFVNVNPLYEDEVIWTNYYNSYEEGIRIFAGKVLTINSSILEFGPEAKLIIEPGAKLITNNTVLTNLNCEPEEKWKGVQVWGDASEHQHEYIGNPCAQGKFVFQNSSVIENAELAVALRNPSMDDTEGGIIIAMNSDFVNNDKAVDFKPYQNYHPTTYEMMEYISYFKNCDFIMNDNYILPLAFVAHVTLEGVYGIDFKGCRFWNSMSTAQNTGRGISYVDAGIRLTDYCNSTLLPCPTEDLYRNEFYNFYAAIDGTNARTVNTPYVNHAIFTNTSYEVKLSSVNNATIINSQFYVGPNTVDEGKCFGTQPYSAGIEMNSCTGFAIEENEFQKAQGAPTGTYIGIRIAETQATDQVYKNTFDSLSYGNYAIGRNWGALQENGLAYYCNENTGNSEDFTVEDVPLQLDGIQDPQGSTEIPAGNTFSASANYNFNNWAFNDWIGYYYYAPSPGYTNTVYYPDYVNRVTREEVVGIQNPCTSHYGGGGIGGGSERGLVLTPEGRQEAELEFATNLVDYNNVKSLYNSLKDGGNTQATIEEVESAWPSDTWELRSDLLGKSPHLSIEVLKTAADKTDVLPESIIFEIMAANPDELKKEELMQYLENKENPLPAYMIDILQQVATGSTYKTVLLREMAQSNQLKTKAAHDIIRSILNDTVTDFNELRNWFDNKGGKRADEQIIATFIQENNFTDATALANMMPEAYNYTNDELNEHNYYLDMLNLQINLKQEERTIFDLDSLEVNDLVFIADNSNSTAGAQAKGILEFAYGYHYCNCIAEDTNGFKNAESFNYNPLNQMFGAEVEIKPNPAHEWTSFNYTLPVNETEGLIKVTDITGKLIETFVITDTQGQKLWDTRKVKTGIYLYTFTVNGISKSGKIVITK